MTDRARPLETMDRVLVASSALAGNGPAPVARLPAEGPLAATTTPDPDLPRISGLAGHIRAKVALRGPPHLVGNQARARPAARTLTRLREVVGNPVLRELGELRELRGACSR